MRRRQRRLREFLRHERLSVAMALAETLHHSSEGGGAARGATGRGPRVVRRPTGTGATSPGDAASTTVRGLKAAARVSAGVLSVAPPALAPLAAEGVDTSTLRFLAKAALDDVRMLEEEAVRRKVTEEAKAKEERKAKYEAKMQVINRRVRDGTATPAEEAAWWRWIGIEAASLIPLDVFLRPLYLTVTCSIRFLPEEYSTSYSARLPEQSTVAFVRISLFLYVVTRILRSILVLLSVFAAKSTGKLDFSVSRSCRQRQLCFLAGFAGYDASYAEFPLVVGRTGMLGILVGMD